MINLLPTELKNSYRYARRNVVLRRWVIICSIAFIGLVVIATYGMVTLHQSTDKYQKKIASANALFQQEQFVNTQKQVTDISNSFKLLVKVLGQEVLFSELLKQMGRAMPADSSLTDLTIVQTKGALNITAVAKDYKTATQVQVNLADPANKIFTKADIVNIKCSKPDTSASATIYTAYPCTVNIQALFAENNPFLFINDAGKVKP